MAAAMKHMASNFAKLEKFEGVDFKRWQKKNHFLLSSMSVVYVLTTPMPEDGGENPTVEQVRRRAKRDNDDYVCRGLILNEVVTSDQAWSGLKLNHPSSFKLRRLVVPYAIGALYNHPLEGLLLDTVGGAIFFFISGMTGRTAVMFFCFATVKTVDDYCGLWLPGNLFDMLFQNNTAYHDVHHQLHGLKYNFSQPFFPIWDKLLGTYMPYDLVKRAEGGFEAKLSKKY
ncbi:sphinganine C4-monooxygenase 1-like protein [Tanacetum coccineum]